MAYTKTQKPLKMSSKKSEYFVDWFIEANYKLICEKLDIKTTKVYKLKNIFVQNRLDGVKDFDSIAKTFTLFELNNLLEIYNEYIENPEKFEQKKKKSEVKLEQQEDTLNKHMKDMGSDSFKYESTDEQVSDGAIKETKNTNNSDDNESSEELRNNESDDNVIENSKEESTDESENDGEELIYKNGAAYRYKERAMTEQMTKSELMKLHSEEIRDERDKLDELEVETEEYEAQQLRIQMLQNRNHAEFHNLLKRSKRS